MTKEQQILNLIDDNEFFEEVIKTALNASSSVHYGYALLNPETLKLQAGWLQRNECWPVRDEIELLVIEPYDDREYCIEDIINYYNNDETREEMRKTVRNFFS